MINQVDIDDATPLWVLYKSKEAYLELRIEDQKFFKRFFPLLLFSPTNEFSHKYLAQVLKEPDKPPIPESTLQKRLRRLDKAKLIRRKTEKERIDGRWITTHVYIDLDPATFSSIYSDNFQERVNKARQEALENDVYLDKQATDKLEQVMVNQEQEGVGPEEVDTFRRLLERL